MSKSIKILHLETSTEVCSVAISSDGVLVAQREVNKGFVHSAKGTLLVEACLKAASMGMNNLDAVSVSAGPGSYTGLRVGFSMAKGICFANDLPMITIPTLEALAYGVGKQAPGVVVSPMIDARRMEVYTASFGDDLTIVAPLKALILDEQSYRETFHSNKKNIFVGDGAHKVKEWLRSGRDVVMDKICSASDQAELAFWKYKKEAFCDIAYTVPLYLKSPNITVSKKNLLT